MPELKHLFQPIKIGNMTLQNRLVLLPLALGYAQDGKPTHRLIKFLEERAEGGIGVVCTPFSIFPSGDTFMGYMGLDASDDKYIDPMKAVADAIHKCAVPIIGQLTTISVWRKDSDADLEFVGPSAVAVRPKAHIPREMTKEEIDIYIRQHGNAARRLREAGYDAVEVMGGVGNIISRFISPLANRRDDEYGGSFKNRMRLPLQIIEDIQKKAGLDYTLLWRYSGHEFMEGGYEVEEAIQIGHALKNAGVKWLNIQVGWHDSQVPLITKEVPQGSFAYIGEAIKKAVGIPVVTSYRITDVVMADRIIAEGKADLVGMARAFISDPELANKAREGRFDDINKCICCCRCVDQTVGSGKSLDMCSVNARIGKDLAKDIKPAIRKKKVLVIGAGPAGMEAARVCAIRGHKVSIWEKNDSTGGSLNLAKAPPDKSEIGYVQTYLESQIKKLGIELRTNMQATAENVINEEADTVIVATGSMPCMPGIAGIDKTDVVSALDVLKGEKGIGDEIVIIGGGLIGCEVASLLVSKGKRVTVLEMLDKIGIDIGPSERFVTVMKLKQSGVRLEPKTRVTEITDHKVKAIRDNQELTWEADSVIIAAGMQSNNGLFSELSSRLKEVYSIGDCVEPRRIGEAIKEGYRVGLQV